MALKDTAIRAAKPRTTQYKMTDGDGLSLLIMPHGAKLWRFRYRHNGIEKMLSLGKYDETGLAEARDKCVDARRLLAKGIDPSIQRARAKQAVRAASEHTFEAFARRWLKREAAGWSSRNTKIIAVRVEKNLLPWLATKTISEVGAADIKKCLHRMTERGSIESAHRVAQYCSSIFKLAISEEVVAADPTDKARNELPIVEAIHHPSIQDPSQLGDLLRALDGYAGQFVVKCAIRLAALVFVRPGELRQAEWSELNLDAAEWRIPKERMKMKRPHIVPLSKQAIAILREIKPLTGDGRLVFPGIRSAGRPLSENTMNSALRILGYDKSQMTTHGWRSVASTLLNESGWRGDAVERQLAHVERDQVRGAYDYSQHLPERRRMMQRWSDFLDGLKAGKPYRVENLAPTA